MEIHRGAAPVNIGVVAGSRELSLNNCRVPGAEGVRNGAIIEEAENSTITTTDLDGRDFRADSCSCGRRVQMLSDQIQALHSWVKQLGSSLLALRSQLFSARAIIAQIGSLSRRAPQIDVQLHTYMYMYSIQL